MLQQSAVAGNAKVIDRLTRSLTSEYSAQLVIWAVELMHLRAHKSDIEKLTKLPGATLTSIARSLFPGSAHGVALMRTGRLPSSIAEVIAVPSVHIEATLFLRIYIDCLAAEGLKREDITIPDLASFVRAAKLSASLVTATRSTLDAHDEDADLDEARATGDGLLDPRRLATSYAVLIATSYHAGDLYMKSCPTCRATYMMTTGPTKVVEKRGVGLCPICRRSVVQPRSMRAPEALSDMRTEELLRRVQDMAAGAAQGETTAAGITAGDLPRQPLKASTGRPVGRPRGSGAKTKAPSRAPSAAPVATKPRKKPAAVVSGDE